MTRLKDERSVRNDRSVAQWKQRFGLNLNARNNFRKVTLQSVCAGLVLFLMAGDLFALPSGMHRPGRQHDTPNQLHPGIHSEGHVGPGVCPQKRTTPQAPDDYLNRKNPLEPTEEILYAGEALFQVDAQPTACKICHGASGNGFGMMAPGLNPPPRNFKCAETMKSIPDGQLFWVIQKGSPGTQMPPYPFLTDEQIWQIVHYLRSLYK